MRLTGIFSRQSRASLSIVALFILLTMTVGLFMSILFRQEHLKQIGRGFYSDEAIFFTFEGNAESNGKQLLTILDIEGQTDYLVVNSVSGVRGVYAKGDPALPPMISGRFLSPDECINGSRLAVVGTNRWPEVETTGQRRTIQLLDQTYEVIGQMGTKYDSALNELVMVGIGSIPVERAANCRFYVDGDNPEELYAGFVQNTKTAVAINIRELDRPTDLVDMTQEVLNFGFLYLTLVIGIMLLSSMVLMVIWMNRQMYRIAVFRLVGYDNRRICSRILGNYLILTLTGVTVAVVIQGVLSVLGIYKIETTYLRQSLLVAACTLLAGVSTAIPAMVRALRADVIRILR